MCALQNGEPEQRDCTKDIGTPTPAGQEPTSTSATASSGSEMEEAAEDVRHEFFAADQAKESKSASERSSSADHVAPDNANYPEGGLQAWTVVLGSFCGMSVAFAMMNTMGIFQAYIAEHMLSGYAESTIGWIFSLYTFLVFFCGVQVGPIFDAYGPKMLVLAGNILLIAMVFLLGLCTEYYQFIVVFGILGGAGTSLLYTPSIASVGHFFARRRGMATGIAAGGGSIGGVAFSLILQSLLPKLGFAWATRVLGFVSIVLCGIAQLLVRSRLPPRRGERVTPDITIFKDPAFALLVAGVCFMEWGLFTPLTYIPSFALSTGAFDTAFAYQLIAILNAGSSVGRWGAGQASDRIGRFNCLTITLLLCLAITAGIWLPATMLAPSDDLSVLFSVKALTITYSLLFGIVSGANISLTPVCVGQLCDTRRYGRYYAACYTAVSFWTLPGIPIAGALLEQSSGRYWSVALFTSASYACAAAGIISARVFKVGWKGRVKF